MSKPSVATVFVLCCPFAAALALDATARAEPRELLTTDGVVLGAIAVSPPPEWVRDPAHPDALQAYVTVDGPWTVGFPPDGGRDRPFDPPLALTLGRPLEAVPRPPKGTLRPLKVDLRIAPGAPPIVELRCPTTELLGEDGAGNWRVRVYREGPSGERHILEGFVLDKPEPGDCGARVAYIDTGNIPADWARVKTGLAAPAASFWWLDQGRCLRWDRIGTTLVSRHTERVDGCATTTEQRWKVERKAGALILSSYSSATRTSCTGGRTGGSIGAIGGSGSTRYTVVDVDANGWRWLSQHGPLEQDPVAYHPDDAGQWFKTRRACEVLATAARVPAP